MNQLQNPDVKKSTNLLRWRTTDLSVEMASPVAGIVEVAHESFELQLTETPRPRRSGVRGQRGVREVTGVGAVGVVSREREGTRVRQADGHRRLRT